LDKEQKRESTIHGQGDDLIPLEKVFVCGYCYISIIMINDINNVYREEYRLWTSDISASTKITIHEREKGERERES